VGSYLGYEDQSHEAVGREDAHHCDDYDSGEARPAQQRVHSSTTKERSAS
jgi:hypothetical protein